MLDGDPAPLPKGAEPPIFGQYLLWPNGWIDQDATWYGVGLGPSDIALDGDPAPRPTKGGRASSQFSAHIYCGQTAGWIKMTLGMEVGLGPGCIVLDEDPAPHSKKDTLPPVFGPFLLWPNCLLHQDAICYGGRPTPRPHCARWGPISP